MVYVHPGQFLKIAILPRLNLTDADVVNRLGVDPVKARSIFNCQRDLDPELATAIEAVLGVPRVLMLALQDCFNRQGA